MSATPPPLGAVVSVPQSVMDATEATTGVKRLPGRRGSPAAVAAAIRNAEQAQLTAEKANQVAALAAEEALLAAEKAQAAVDRCAAAAVRARAVPYVFPPDFKAYESLDNPDLTSLADFNTMNADQVADIAELTEASFSVPSQIYKNLVERTADMMKVAQMFYRRNQAARGEASLARLTDRRRHRRRVHDLEDENMKLRRQMKDIAEAIECFGYYVPPRKRPRLAPEARPSQLMYEPPEPPEALPAPETLPGAGVLNYDPGFFSNDAA